MSELPPDVVRLLHLAVWCADERHRLTKSERLEIAGTLWDLARERSPKRAGKPPAPKMEIALDVLVREQIEAKPKPKPKRENVVNEVAADWKVSPSTVWEALKSHEAEAEGFLGDDNWMQHLASTRPQSRKP